jgi:hypothetical protein
MLRNGERGMGLAITRRCVGDTEVRPYDDVRPGSDRTWWSWPLEADVAEAVVADEKAVDVAAGIAGEGQARAVAGKDLPSGGGERVVLETAVLADERPILHGEAPSDAELVAPVDSKFLGIGSGGRPRDGGRLTRRPTHEIQGYFPDFAEK